VPLQVMLARSRRVLLGGALAPSVAAVGGAVALTLWASLAAGAAEELVAAAGIFGSALLAVALLGRWPDVLPWAIALLGGQYAASLLLRDAGIDPFAPLYAAVLFVTAELAYWGLEVKPALGGVVGRLASLVGLAFGTALVGAALLALSEGGEERGFGLQLVGLLAAAATLALVTWLAWRSRLR
jgi:hypothetical protein